jgi:hypothetical protein
LSHAGSVYRLYTGRRDCSVPCPRQESHWRKVLKLLTAMEYSDYFTDNAKDISAAKGKPTTHRKARIRMPIFVEYLHSFELYCSFNGSILDSCGLRRGANAIETEIGTAELKLDGAGRAVAGGSYSPTRSFCILSETEGPVQP